MAFLRMTRTSLTPLALALMVLAGGLALAAPATARLSRPRISSVSESRHSFVPSRYRRGRAVVFRLWLNRPAEIRVLIRRELAGRRVGRSCRTPTPALRYHRRCTRTVAVTALAAPGHTGLNRIPFSGRIRRRGLKPGHYKAVFSAVNARGASRSRILSFRVV